MISATRPDVPAAMVRVYDSVISRLGARGAWVVCLPVHTVNDVVGRVRDVLQVPTCRLCRLLNGRELGPDENPPIRPYDQLDLAPSPGDPGTVLLAALSIASALGSAYLASRVNVKPLSSSAEPESRRFGWNRFSNDAVAGDVVPVPFGERERYGGKVIAKVPYEHADGSGESSLRMLLCLGHGQVEQIANQTADFDNLPASAVEDLWLNDQPAVNFPGVRVSGRMGTAGQFVMPGFDDVETLREIGAGGAVLRNTSGMDRTGPNASAEAVLFTTLDPVDAVVARVVFTGGLYQLSASGQLDSRRVQYRYRTRLTAGPGPWSAWTVVTLERADQSEFFSSPRIDNLGAVGRDVQLERVTKEDPGNLSVADEMVWHSAIEVTYASNRYENFAVLGIELVASEQLTSPPRVSFRLKGRRVRVWDGVSSPSAPVFVTQYTTNPAWIALDVLTNKTWGMGKPDSSVNMPDLIAWAQYCDEMVERPDGTMRRRFRFDYVLEDDRPPVEWLRTIGLAAACMPVTVGEVWRFAVDRPRSNPVEIFTDGDIAVDEQGHAQITYGRELATGGVVRPNQLIGQFENATQAGEPDLFAYPEPGEVWLATEQANPQTVKLEGITDPDQAVAEILYRISKLRFQSRTIEFVTTRPVVAVQPGDRFDLATSLPGWALASGRLQSPSIAESVRLDRTVTLAGGTAYSITVLHPDGTTDTRAVAAPAGTYAAGDPIALQAPLSKAPLEFAEYALGPTGTHLKPFVCTGIALEDARNFLWRVRGIEYVEGVFSGDPASVVLPNYSTLHSPSTPPGPVLKLKAREVRPPAGTSGGTGANIIVELSWTQKPEDAEHTSTFRVYRRRIGTTTWILVPNLTPGRRAVVLEISAIDAAYEFTVVAVSIGGAFLSPYDPRVPIVRLVFGLSVLPPPPPAAASLVQTGGNTYTLSWTPVASAVEYQVLFGGDTTSRPNAGAEDCLVLKRTAATQITGLELPPTRACSFWVRSVGANGRLSFTGRRADIANPALPPGEVIKDIQTFNLAAVGTLVNLAHSAGALRLVNPAAAGTWTGPEVTLPSLSLTELTFRPGTGNGADDPVISTNPFSIPSIQADQWGVYATGPHVVGMLMPPWPDAEHSWTFKVRTFDGVAWSTWEALAPLASIRRTFSKYQLEVTIARQTFPYRPTLRSLAAVCTH